MPPFVVPFAICLLHVAVIIVSLSTERWQRQLSAPTLRPGMQASPRSGTHTPSSGPCNAITMSTSRVRDWTSAQPAYAKQRAVCPPGRFLSLNCPPARSLLSDASAELLRGTRRRTNLGVVYEQHAAYQCCNNARHNFIPRQQLFQLTKCLKDVISTTTLSGASHWIRELTCGNPLQGARGPAATSYCW